MDYKIRWSKKAVADLEDICEFISKDSAFYASVTATKIFFSISSLKTFPKRGRIVPEYNDENIRELIFKVYRIVYRLKSDFIEIATICHSSKKNLEI